MANIKLREARLAASLTQHEICGMIGIKQPLYSQIETGRTRPWPKLRRLLSEKLNLTESELFPNDD